MSGDSADTLEHKALRRLLRRRGRRGKVGANSGEPVSLPAGHRSTKFTPSGAYSRPPFSLTLILIFCFSAVLFVISKLAGIRDDDGFPVYDFRWIEDGIVVGVTILVILATLMAAVLIVVGLVRVVSENLMRSDK